MSYFKNISTIQTKYTTYLVSKLTPLIYEGMVSLYEDSIHIHEQIVGKSKNDPNVKSPGVLKIFQTNLRAVPNFNQQMIEAETNRIKVKSGCTDYFDNLIKAVIKSNVMLLAYPANQRQAEERYGEYFRISTGKFVHNCYISCARVAYDNADLFLSDLSPIEQKKNQRELMYLLDKAINNAICDMVPLELTLDEFVNGMGLDIVDTDIAGRERIVETNNVRKIVEWDLKNQGQEQEQVQQGGESKQDHDDSSHDEEENNSNNGDNESSDDDKISVEEVSEIDVAIGDMGSNSEMSESSVLSESQLIAQPIPQEEKVINDRNVKSELDKLANKSETETATPKKRRGRPRKNLTIDTQSSGLMRIQSNINNALKKKKVTKGVPPAKKDPLVKEALQNIELSSDKKGRKKNAIKELIKKEQQDLNRKDGNESAGRFFNNMLKE
jgi:hypothetical protein